MAENLVELAIEALEARKAAIDEEIARLRGQRGRGGRRSARGAEAPAARGKRRRRKRSAAARRAQAQKMREYWARRKAAAGETGKKSKK